MEEQQYRNVLPRGFWLKEYQIESVLGKPGGFGITYLAMDTHLRQSVAIKEYLPTDFAVREGRSTVLVRSSSDDESFQWGLNCFIEEARVLAKFKHASIVRVLRFFEANGTAYMVMEYQQGSSLADYLKQQHILKEEELLTIVLPLLDGLTEIHKVNLLHRDIKPNNIYIRSEDNSPVLLDFGSARLAIGQKTRTLTSIVTPGYAPLEQYDNEISTQGPWTDIYALGAVMYYAINGEPPPAATRRVGKVDPMVPAVKIGEGKYKKNLLRAIDSALQLSEEDRPRTVGLWRNKMLDPPVKILSQAESLSQYRWLSILNTISLVVILSLAATVGVLWHQNQVKNQEIRAALAEIDKANSTSRKIEKQLLMAEEKIKIERRHRKAAERHYQDAKHEHKKVQALLKKIINLDGKIKKPTKSTDNKKKHFNVFNVRSNDFLYVREYPGHNNNEVGKIPPGEKCIEYLGDSRLLEYQLWIKIQYLEVKGWVNSSYLNENKHCNGDKDVE